MSTDSEDLSLRVRRWISVADIISLAVTLAVFAAGYGRLSGQMESMTLAMQELQRRDMTPGAAVAISAMQARDQAQDAQLEQLREDSIEYRREVRAALERIEARLEELNRRSK